MLPLPIPVSRFCKQDTLFSLLIMERETLDAPWFLAVQNDHSMPVSCKREGSDVSGAADVQTRSMGALCVSGWSHGSDVCSTADVQTLCPTVEFSLFFYEVWENIALQ